MAFPFHYRTFWDLLGTVGNFWDLLGSFGIFWDLLGPLETFGTFFC